MTPEQNKKIVQQLFTEGICKKNLDIIDRLVDPSFVNHGIPGAKKGPEGFREIIETFLNAFPDMDITLEKVIAEGDLVATHGCWKATHQGQFMGIHPAGKQVNVRYMDFWRVVNGKCVENWVQMDLLSLMKQLGVLSEAVEV